MEGSAIFWDASAEATGWGLGSARGLAFGEPVALRRAETLAEVPGVVDWAEAESRAGRWVVLALAYEAAPAFDDALPAHAPQAGLPLAWAASHDAPLPELPSFLEKRVGIAGENANGDANRNVGEKAGERNGEKNGGTCASGPWRPLIRRADYDARLNRLRQLIAEGETYQANYTLPFECACSCAHPREGASAAWSADQLWFAELARSQGAGFCAWLNLGRHRALSLSPELFFSTHDGVALARPMKGTAPRGATRDEDDALRRELAASPKNRAENVMIVDLLRSDLGRVAVPGGVDTPALFRVEAYPTVFQMTSDVRARLRPGISLFEILAALFPCGSVTGAPKVRTMQLLRELEPHPRGLYCGAIGLLEPHGGSSTFSVPIRTLTLDTTTKRARFGVGGGVTWDSTASGEWAECQAKMRFLSGGEFDLLESLLLTQGRYPLLRRHLERLAASALRFDVPLDLDAVREALGELALRHPEGQHKVRLLVSPQGALHAEAAPITRDWTPLAVGWAGEPVQSADPMLRHKTTRRAIYEAALAAEPHCGDVLLLNERGEVTESTRANIVLYLDGQLLTPPLSSGLLPGVFRAMLLGRGRVRERVLTPADVARANAAGRVWLVNSVRGWMNCVVRERKE